MFFVTNLAVIADDEGDKEYSNLSEWKVAEFETDHCFVENEASGFSPFNFDTGGGGTLSESLSIPTNTIYVEGRDLKYAL